MIESSDVFGTLVDLHSREDVYSHYRSWLSEHPVIDTGIGVVFVFSYQTCLELLRDRRLSVDQRNSATNTEPNRLSTLINLDPPDHTRLRRLVQGAFTPRRVDTLRQNATAFIERTLPTLDNRTNVDLIEELAYPLPLSIICDLLGIPQTDHDCIRQWSATLAKSIDPSEFRTEAIRLETESAQEEFITYLAELVKFRRRHPGDDLLSQLVQADNADDRMTELELYGLAVLLLVAGHETTVNLIGNGLLALLTHRDQFRLVGEQGTDLRVAIDELLRFDSPVQMTSRIATETVTVEDTLLQKGQTAVLMLGAANHDPAAFSLPQQLNVAQPRSNAHLAFGNGLHHCLGAALARVEGELAIGNLLRRFPDMQLQHTPQLRPTFVLRGRESLVVSTGKPHR